MLRVLVIDDEPSICNAVGEVLRGGLGAEVESALTGFFGAQKIANRSFDLAIIDGRSSDFPTFELATSAANKNIAVIIMSGDAETSIKLHQFGYQFLVKPFSISALLYLTSEVMREGQKNIRRVKASAAKMLADAERLKIISARSQRLLDEGETKWLARGITLKPMLFEDC